MKKEIPSFPGYYVSKDGVVFSSRGRWPSKNQKALLPRVNERGYLRVGLRRDGRNFSVPVHRLVCEAFNGPPPKGAQCRHLDGNRKNNTPGNLKWGTAMDNFEDKRAHGNVAEGERHGSHKLSADDVRFIRKNYVPGRHWPKPGNVADLSKMFGVSRAAIQMAYNGDTWKAL